MCVCVCAIWLRETIVKDMQLLRAFGLVSYLLPWHRYATCNEFAVRMCNNVGCVYHVVCVTIGLTYVFLMRVLDRGNFGRNRSTEPSCDSTESPELPVLWAVSRTVLVHPAQHCINRLYVYHLCCHRPKYRYPYYDENGKGKLLYGYGGPELYQYKSYSPLEGIHWVPDHMLLLLL